MSAGAGITSRLLPNLRTGLWRPCMAHNHLASWTATITTTMATNSFTTFFRGQTSPSTPHHPDRPGEIVQPKTLYAFDGARNKWLPVKDIITSAPTSDSEPAQTNPSIKSFNLITYNIDAMNYHVNQRLRTIFSFLNTHTVAPSLALSPPVPTIILVQELQRNAMPGLLEHPAVREGFCVTDITTRDWRVHYGTITLVPRALALAGRVKDAFETPFLKSGMGRSALYVDIDTGLGMDAGANAQEGHRRVMRIANVHLESLRGRADTMRVEQLESVSERLRAPGVYAGLVAGDMNPIGPYDDDAPGKLGLSDAWIVCQEQSVAGSYIGRPKTKDEWEGYTWGEQPPSRFPKRRMDKILFTGPLEPKEVDVVGKGMMAEGEDIEPEDATWVSDHYGLVARIDVV